VDRRRRAWPGRSQLVPRRRCSVRWTSGFDQPAVDGVRTVTGARVPAIRSTCNAVPEKIARYFVIEWVPPAAVQRDFVFAHETRRNRMSDPDAAGGGRTTGLGGRVSNTCARRRPRPDVTGRATRRTLARRRPLKLERPTRKRHRPPRRQPTLGGGDNLVGAVGVVPKRVGSRSAGKW